MVRIALASFMLGERRLVIRFVVRRRISSSDCAAMEDMSGEVWY